METKNEILEAINKLTLEIESQFPELYRFLDESPDTIPSEAHPHLGPKELSTYYEGLKTILEDYKKTHSSRK